MGDMTSGGADAEERARRLAGESVGAGDATGWFERLYAAAEASNEVVAWDRGAPHRILVEWAEARGLAGGGRRALVVGSGTGDDAEYVSGLGFDTVAFDISGSAVRAAHRRYPGTRVQYVVADLLDPPAAWQQAFDLVVESLTLQALPDPPRRDAIRRLGELVAPGGTLIVNERARDTGDGPDNGPPWALTRAEIDAIGASGLRPVRIEDLREPQARRWRAEFRRPSAGGA